MQVAPITLSGARRAVGSSSFMDIRPRHRCLKTRRTWISRKLRAIQVNPETKYLTCHHAFEALGCVRVPLETDARDEQSQRAMTRLGCTREPDGFVRDTLVFSVDTDWPVFPEALHLRLEYRA